MPNFGVEMPLVATGEETKKQESVEEDKENIEMSENEKNAEEWIKKNEIKEGTKLDWNGMDTLVTEIDFSERVFSYEIIEPGHEEKKTVTFEKLGEGINFLNNFTKVKESE